MRTITPRILVWSACWLWWNTPTLNSYAAPAIPLRAGPVSMIFEPDNAFLRYLKVGPHEILRGITAPVRNQYWGTVLPVLSNVQVENRGDGFRLTFEAVCREREIDFLWHGTIEGRAHEIIYTFDGVARSDFRRNRIGFCVLHGPSAAGKRWVIENVRGERSPGRFPEFISPHQPAKEIREVAHEVAPGFWARVRMEGDTFEMEDQRNWTDASFKTYCTPLGMPYPVAITQGTKVTQKISIRFEGTAPKSPEGGDTDTRPVLTLAGEEFPLPRFGLQVSSQMGDLTDVEIERLQALRLDHLRVDLALTNESFRQRLRQATAQARALGVKLHVGLRLGSQPESALDRLAAEVRATRSPVAIWFVIGADASLHQLARQRLRELGGKPLVGALHEDINFTQLNRIRPAPTMLEVVGYGVTPQIHAFDDLSIMETLPILTDTVRSARQFIGNSPLWITPVTLRLQAESQVPLPGELPSSVDPRQVKPFTAAWTLGSFKYLAEAGVQGVTYYETVGWKGLMESAGGTPLPARFPSQPGAVYPVYHLLQELAEFNGGRAQRIDSSDTLSVAGLALRHGKRRRLLVANLTARPLSVAVRGWVAASARSLPLGASSGGSTVSAELPLLLSPYGVVRVDP